MRSIVALLPLPFGYFILVVLAILMRGPSNGMAIDADWAYFIVGANVAGGFPAHMLVHPGITLISIIAAVVRVAAFFLNSGDSISTAIQFGEPLLLISTITLTALLTAAAFACSVAVLLSSGSVALALSLQCGLFASQWGVRWQSRLMPEVLMVLAALALATILYSAAIKEQQTKETSLKAASAAGIVVGLGVATKILFAPFIAWPLILYARNWRALLLIFICTAFGFLGGFSVALGEINKFVTFFVTVSTHTGTYGAGAKGLIDWGVFISNISRLWSDSQLQIALTFVLMGIIVIYQILIGRKILPMQLFLVGGAACIVLKLLLSLKQYNSQYIVEAFSILPFMLVVGFQLLWKRDDAANHRNDWRSFVPLALVALILLPSSISFFQQDTIVRARQVFDERKIQLALTRLPAGCKVLPYFESGLERFGYSFGFEFSLLPEIMAAYRAGYEKLGLQPPVQYSYFDNSVFVLGKYIPLDDYAPPGACVAFVGTYPLKTEDKPLAGRISDRCLIGRNNVYLVGPKCEVVGLGQPAG